MTHTRAIRRKVEKGNVHEEVIKPMILHMVLDMGYENGRLFFFEARIRSQ